MDRAREEQLAEKQQKTLNGGLLFAVFILLVGIAFAIFGLTDNIERTVSFSESGSSVSYQVHLLPNTSYNEQYLEGSPDLSYPTNLIDYLDLNYLSTVNFSEKVEGELQYKLVALTSADKIDGDTHARLGSDEETLIESDTAHVSDDSVMIGRQAKIDYSKYVDMIRRFETEAQGVTAKGSLNVALIISGSIKPESFDSATDHSSRVDFTIPIASNSSVEAKTSVKSGSDATLKESPAGLDPTHLIAAISGIILILTAVGIVIYWLIFRFIRTRTYPFETRIKQLLNSYDSIIVEVTRPPVSEGGNISEVDNFDELLDVYNSVHLPINFYPSGNEGHFVINGEKNVWRYVIKKKDLERNGKKKASR